MRDLDAIRLAAELGVPVKRLWAKLGLDFSGEDIEAMEAEAGSAESGATSSQITAADHTQAQADLDALRGVMGGES